MPRDTSLSQHATLCGGRARIWKPQGTDRLSRGRIAPKRAGPCLEKGTWELRQGADPGAQTQRLRITVHSPNSGRRAGRPPSLPKGLAALWRATAPAGNSEPRRGPAATVGARGGQGGFSGHICHRRDALSRWTCTSRKESPTGLLTQGRGCGGGQAPWKKWANCLPDGGHGSTHSRRDCPDQQGWARPP